MVTGSKIDIEDKRSPLEKDFNGESLPEIGGCNFFYGEYSGAPNEQRSLSNTQDNAQWEDFWRTCLKEEPPGPLPKGAHAILLAGYDRGNPVAHEPESLTYEDDGLKVLWNRIQLRGEPQGSGKSRYGVLILPVYGGQTTRETTWQEEFGRAAEKRKLRDEKIIALSKPFTEGTEDRIVLLPTIRYRHRFAFLKT
ncbi:MAG: hypothetical protein ACAH83_17125 [Alphaproteobacteria bacterium]